jgi:predicted DsbA family dithiol-disulfide isomerase
MPISLELYADLVCPWCWIGDRRLQAALTQVRNAHPEVEFDLTWRPFQLDPSMPVEGRSFETFVEEKFGGRARAEPMFARVADAGAADGLPFRFDRITRMPNTVRAHGLVMHAQQTGRDPWPLIDALFAAHFEHGLDTGDASVLTALAVGIGMSDVETRDVIASGRYDVDVQQSQKEAARLGIQGVPFLVLDNHYGVSGAQPLSVFVEALTRVAADR